MNPKQKAAYLVVKYMSKVVSKQVAIECALVAVDEILSMGIMSDSGDWRMAKSYWQEVKQEIEKI